MPGGFGRAAERGVLWWMCYKVFGLSLPHLSFGVKQHEQDLTRGIERKNQCFHDITAGHHCSWLGEAVLHQDEQIKCVLGHFRAQMLCKGPGVCVQPVEWSGGCSIPSGKNP